MVRAIRKHLPSVSLTLKEMVSRVQLEGLAAGHLDLGFVRPPAAHMNIDSVAFSREGLVLAIPASEADQWPEKPSLECLHHRNILMYSPYEASYSYQLLVQLFALHEVTPNIVEYVTQIHTMHSSAASGMGVALVPESASNLRLDDIVLRRMNSDPVKPLEFMYARRKDNDNPVLEIVRKQILPDLAKRIA